MGTMIKPLNLLAGISFRFSTIGRAYARVFPEPVGAETHISPDGGGADLGRRSWRRVS